MKYGSVCSGVEAATMAWHHMGWTPSFFSEIEEFPRAVLQHHYPEVPLHGDFTTIGEKDYESIDLLVGGTPCQSFSIAGLRGGMADDRGNLALEFLRLAQRLRPRWIVWENVPGVLSSNGGRDFSSFLKGLEEIGYGFSYRILNAQYFGVPQRRRRVFVVGYLGDWRPSTAVLFERHSLSWNPPKSREEGEGFARGFRVSPTANCLQTTCNDYSRADGFNMIPIAVDAYNGQVSSETHATVSTKIDHNRNLLCFEPRSPDGVPRIHGETCPTLNTMGGGQREPCVAIKENGCQTVRQGMQVRRLTEVECERLQGFPDNFTRIPYRGKPLEQCPRGHRYKAMGNSMAVPVMRWIGERIQKVQNILEEL